MLFDFYLFKLTLVASSKNVTLTNNSKVKYQFA